MKVGTVRERLVQHASDVLNGGSTDEVFLISDQLRVLAGALAGLPDDDDVDLAVLTADTALAARMLSYHAEHVRRLIRQNTIRATKVGADYRIPLEEIFAVLVRRHRDEAIPELLPRPRREVVAELEIGGNVELAIDVSIVRAGDRRTIRLQRFNLELGELLRDQSVPVNGESVGVQPDA